MISGMSVRIDRVRAYYEASSRADWQAAGACTGPGYPWIDHATGVVAKSAEQLQEATADEAPWSGVSFEIESAFETDDAVIVQAVRRGTITGSWRSMESPGRSVSFPLCTIFKFNADNKIVYEEAYYDMQAISRQLGYHPAAAR
jgi:predicted ester cyclase